MVKIYCSQRRLKQLGQLISLGLLSCYFAWTAFEILYFFPQYSELWTKACTKAEIPFLVDHLRLMGYLYAVGSFCLVAGDKWSIIFLLPTHIV